MGRDTWVAPTAESAVHHQSRRQQGHKGRTGGRGERRRQLLTVPRPDDLPVCQPRQGFFVLHERLILRVVKPAADECLHIDRTIHAGQAGIPTTVLTSRSNGCCQAVCGLIAATTITTAVVIPVVTMSSRRPNTALISVLMPSSAARPTGVNGKIRRYGKHSAKLTQVAIRRAIPEDRARARVP